MSTDEFVGQLTEAIEQRGGTIDFTPDTDREDIRVLIERVGALALQTKIEQEFGDEVEQTDAPEQLRELLSDLFDDAQIYQSAATYIERRSIEDEAEQAVSSLVEILTRLRTCADRPMQIQLDDIGASYAARILQAVGTLNS